MRKYSSCKILKNSKYVIKITFNVSEWNNFLQDIPNLYSGTNLNLMISQIS